MGQALRGVLGEALQNPDVAAEVREFARGSTTKMMREIVANAVTGGEYDPDLVTDSRIEAGPALLPPRFIFTAGPIGDNFLVGVVDQMVLPLFGVRPKASRQRNPSRQTGGTPFRPARQHGHVEGDKHG